MDTFFQDIRFALRLLRKNPGFSLVVILTLALGIGANAAIFSIVNGVLLRPLPFREPSRLVRITFNSPGLGLRDIPFSIIEFDDLKTRTDVFDDTSVVFPASVNLTGGKEPERHELLGVSANYFSLLGATPQRGRLIDQQDFARGFAEAAIISDGLWRRSYGADPAALGKRLKLDNDPYTIVGVLPPGFRHPGRTVAGDVEVWVTAGFSADPFPPPTRSARLLPGAIARLKPNVTLEQARIRLNTLSAELQKDFPNDYPTQARWSIEIEPLQESLVGNVRPQLLLLLVAVVLIVLIASVNIANLFLARASGRQRETALRLALGATPRRLIRQMLTESVLLSLIAGTAGVLTAYFALGLILQFVPSSVPRLSEVRIDWIVLAFALLVSILTGVAFGLAPALRSSRTDLMTAIREGAQGSGYSAKTLRLRGLLIGSELALAVVLMIGAGLLLRTFLGLLKQDIGFNSSSVVAASIWLPVPNDPKTDPYLDPTRRLAFNREVLRRVAEIPGITQAALTSDLPGSRPLTNAPLTIEDRPSDPSQPLTAELIRVSPAYFSLLQNALVEGRFFEENDETGKQDVALVDQTTARRYWSGRDPVGRRIRLGANPTAPWVTVIGVVHDMKLDGFDVDAVPHIFRPIYQASGRVLSIVAKTTLPAAQLEPQIRGQIQTVDPNLPVFNVRSLGQILDSSLAPRRFSAQLVGIFALVALLLSSVGIYGLLAYMVGQRSREIGVRVAMGALPKDILRLVIGQGLRLASLGIIAGLVLALLAAPAIASLLYGVRPVDLQVFLTVPLVFFCVALLATSFPAGRAARVDPAVALRES